MEAIKKCTRAGCAKDYKESENNDKACRFHSGKVVFHDIKKGWACCDQYAYDWDDFQKIPGCSYGKHTDDKKLVEFQKSALVTAAEKVVQKENEVKIKSPEDYNKEMEEKKKKEEEELKKKGIDPSKKQPVMREGKFVCGHLGCNKLFAESENTDGCCKFHSGAPYFHDIKKSWTCCQKEAWDWDEFQKIPTCSVGKHVMKYK